MSATIVTPGLKQAWMKCLGVLEKTQGVHVRFSVFKQDVIGKRIQHNEFGYIGDFRAMVVECMT